MIDLCWRRYREREYLIYLSQEPGARMCVICNTVVVDTSLAQGLIRLRLFYSHGNIQGPPPLTQFRPSFNTNKETG